MGKRELETSEKTDKTIKKFKGDSQNTKRKFSKNDKPSKPVSNTDTKNEQKQIFKHYQKRNFDKNSKSNNLKEKPADWNEFKKKKKELRLKRKQNNSLFEVITKAKQIGETLRRKTLDGGKEERDKLVNELHQLLGNQGNYVKLVLAHDMARIVQYMLKFGNEKVRNEIMVEITPSTVQMLQSKYGRYCIKRLFKYGSAKTRSNAIKAMYGNAVKLTSHAVSAPIFEYIYSTWAQPIEKIHLIQEFFGDLYKQSKEDNIKHLKDVYKNSPDMKAAALGAVKANLSKILNKDLLDSGLIQTVVYQYLTECSENDRNELISQIAPHAVVIGNSKDGAKAVRECIWHGTNKDRKVIVKAVKEHILELCKHEYGHTVVIAILDTIDDTVLVSKSIISEILKHTVDIAKDDWGRKVILWLVTPGVSAHFHPAFTNELENGRQKSNSKKSSELRRKEILEYSTENLLTSINTDTKLWFSGASISVVALSILKTGDGQLLSDTLGKVAEVIIDDDWKVTENEQEILGIEHAGLHMTLKKLVQNDKEALINNKPLFSEALFSILDENVVC
ncbi:hypothetical protein MML48_8g00018351 [Holotrichia oblita]|uniref:Uncharacterized protein n=1 Tax=Holotrichia oblita TaxID=644536 RepID=A0ACB9SNF1_HOLOL|nr:hypothetical protein MML48_8g00018351 [Holotrichia oblita]